MGLDDKEQGGSGGGRKVDRSASLFGEGVRTTRMMERALKQRWPIKEEWREVLLERQAKIASDPGSSPREATAAFKAILAADQINLNAELGNVEERLGALEDAEVARREGNRP